MATVSEVEREGGGRILVVDDKPHIVELVRYNLTQEGFDVSVAYDGREALEKTRQDAPDLVILDLMLPYIDGLEGCRHLRRDTSIPILILTAKDSEQDRVLGLNLGADDLCDQAVQSPGARGPRPGDPPADRP